MLGRLKSSLNLLFTKVHQKYPNAESCQYMFSTGNDIAFESPSELLLKHNPLNLQYVTY